MNEIAHAIDYVLEHLENRPSTLGDIHKFVTIVFYAQASLVECYTKIVKLDKANKVSSNAFKVIVTIDQSPNRTDFCRFEFGSVRFGSVRFGSTAF